MTSFFVIFACGHALLSTARLWRAYAGTMPNGLVTLSNADAAMLTTKQRRRDVVLGICSLAACIAYLYLALMRHPLS